MKKIIFFALLHWSTVGLANDNMTLDDAVTHLLKDFEGARISPNREGQIPAFGVDLSNQMQSQNPRLSSDGSTYAVKRGETLDQVIRRLAPNSELRLSMLRRAFVQANPHAFRRNNPNWMYSGAVLKVPDLDDLRRVIFKDSVGSLKKNVSDEKAGWVRFP